MTTTTPWASVVVRTFNSERTLTACLESLCSQTIRPEIIVVDSGSSDQTMTIASRMADRLVLLSHDSFSYGRALNRGAEVAAGRVHFAVSSHCVIPRTDWIARALTHYERPGIAATNGQLTDPEGSPLREPLLLGADTPTPNPLWGFSNHASSWRADIWRRERFNEQLIAGEDLEWSDRVLALGFIIVFDPELTVLPHHYKAEGAVGLYRRSKREFLGAAGCRSVQPPTLRQALTEWWTERPPGTKPWRQRLSPYRIALISGRYVAGRKIRFAPQHNRWSAASLWVLSRVTTREGRHPESSPWGNRGHRVGGHLGRHTIHNDDR